MDFRFSSQQLTPIRPWAAGVLLLLLGVLSAGLYRHTLWLPPGFHHVWAQADWLALALNFRQRGFDFFHPATYNLLTREGVTGAAFPLPAYLTALLMQLTNSEAPGLMRLLTLLLSLGGLAMLFALVHRASNSATKAGLAALFAFCSPLYGYYQANFLPSVPAYAAALAGYYGLYRCCQPTSHASRWLYAAVALLTLAAAIRTPFAVPLLASLLHLGGLRPRPAAAALGRARVAGAYGAAGVFLGGYFYYNEYLTRYYGGSMFLARPLPFHSAAEAWATTRLVAEKWGFDLLSGWQWLTLGLVVLGALSSRPARAWMRWEWTGHWLLLAGGSTAYYLLMGPQYIDHDYYFIDSLLLPLVLLFAGALTVLPVPARRGVGWAALTLAAALVLLWVRDTQAVQTQRYSAPPDDRGQITLRNFSGSARLLDSLGVARSARVMVLDAYSFNLPLLLMQRQGWTVLTTSEENLRNSFREPADLFVTQNAFFRSDVVNNYPLLLERLDSVFSDGRLTVWRPRTRMPPVIWQVGADMESTLDSTVYYNQNRTEERAASGRFASHLPETATYGLTFARPVQALDLRAHDRLVLRANCWLPTGTDYSARLVVSLEPANGGPSYYWRGLDCRRYQGPPERWTTVGEVLELPAPHAPTDLLKVYLMKEGAVSILLDDLTLTLLR